MRLYAAIAVVLWQSACGSEAEPPPAAPPAPPPCPAPTRLVAHRCVEPGVSDDGCPAGTLAQDGGCRAAGILPGECGAGFAHDGDVGCDPILPPTACLPGLMAVPGEATCRKVMECGPGAWGDLPVDGNTVYVDQAFGGVSDGSSSAPYRTISEAVVVASAGQLIAVAAGSYAEDVLLQGTAVRLWGVCPERVEMVGTGVEPAALRIQGASGTEVGGVAIRGASRGVQIAGSGQVRIERVWVHDNATYGVLVQSAGPTAVEIGGSLIEENRVQGLYVLGAELLVESSVVRTTLPDTQGYYGRGISIETDIAGAPSTAVVRASVVQENGDLGIRVEGSVASIESSVVRTTLSDAEGLFGRGVGVETALATGGPSNASVRASVVDGNHDFGVFVEGSEVAIESSVVRGTLPNGQGMRGWGLAIQEGLTTGAPSTGVVRASLLADNTDIGAFVEGSEVTIESSVLRGTLPDTQGLVGRAVNIQPGTSTGAASLAFVRGSVLEDNHELGLFVAGSEATAESTVVRGTLPDAQGFLGRGINMEAALLLGATSHVTVRTSVVEDNHDVGINVSGSEAIIEATIVRGTLPDDQGRFGRGINIQPDPTTGAASRACIDACLIEANHEMGAGVSDSEATVRGSRVLRTLANGEGLYGDGLVAYHGGAQGQARLWVEATSIDDSARAGVASFGGFASLGATTARCSAFDLVGEATAGIAFQLEDRGGNACGCPVADGPCKAVSVGLAPPAPLASVE